MPAARTWTVQFDSALWSVDMLGASARATQAARRWRRADENHGVPHAHLRACRAEDDNGVHLSRCVKVRLPNPLSAALTDSPWGVVLEVVSDDKIGLHLAFLAFGLRHPSATGSSQTSVYERAHSRLP